MISSSSSDVSPAAEAPAAPPTRLSQLSSSAPAFQRLASIGQTPGQPTSTARKRAKNKEPVLALTPEAAEISFLKQELNNAQTKITMLDTEIDDLNKTIKIQRQRLSV